MSSNSEIRQSVEQLYISHPFPQWTPEQRRLRFGAELSRYRCLGLAEAMPGARFLDAGCGTGNRSMLVARHFGVRRFVGLDHSRSSLAVARRVAREEGFDRFTPLRGDLLNLPFPDESFDVAVAWGTLHHTADAFRGLQELSRVCRRGGLVAVFLYNRFNHWRHNRQKARVDRLAGPGFEDRFQVAHRLYGVKPIQEMSPDETVTFYDQYCHPHKTDHTLGETLGWFRELGLEYHGSFLPLRILDTVRFMQYRARLLGEHPTVSRWTRVLARYSALLPELAPPRFPSRPPTPLHRFAWQGYWAWKGRHGEYSDGASLSARKR